MKNKIFSQIFFIIFIQLFAPVLVMAGPPPTGGDPGIPIDGGASFLVGAAAVYFTKKLKRQSKDK